MLQNITIARIFRFILKFSVLVQDETVQMYNEGYKKKLDRFVSSNHNRN